MVPVALSGVVETAVLLIFPVAVLAATLDLDGVTADTRDADVFPDVLDTDAVLSTCDLETEAVAADLPVLLAVAMPPRVETRLVWALSAPVLCLEPCQ